MTRQQTKALFLSVLVVLSLGATVAFTGSAAAELDPEAQEAVDETNEAIEETNTELEEELYPELEMTDPPTDLEIEPIEADNTEELQAEVERLREDLEGLKTGMPVAVAEEINANAQDIIGKDLVEPSDIESPDDAREEGDELEEEYGDVTDRAEDGKEGLHSMADRVENLDSDWEPRLEELDSHAYSETGTVTGTVVDEDGDPIEGVEVAPESGPGDDTTGDDGTYEFETSTGEVTLEFSGDGYEATTQEATVEENESTTADDASMAAAEGGDGGSGGALFDSLLSTGGLVLAVIGIGGMLATTGLGVLRRDDDVATLRTTAATVGLLAVTGLAIGATGHLSITWALETWPDDAVLGQFAPLIALLSVFLVAPTLTVLLGVVESDPHTGTRETALRALTIMGGVVLLVLLALGLIAQAGSSGDAVATIDGVSVAGIVGTVSAVGYTISAYATGRQTDGGSNPSVPTAD